MKQPTDWNKQSVIATWVGIAVTMIIWILSYVRPADPAHPMSFDFLSQTITIPVWQAFTTAIIAVATGILVYRWRRNRIPTIEGQSVDNGLPAVPKPPPSLSSKIIELPKPLADAQQAVQQKPLVISSSAYNISVEIKEHTSKGNSGLVISVVNNRLSRIGTTTLSVKSARSFDYRHNDYRDGSSFTAFAVTMDTSIEPSCKGSPTWFVRRDSQYPDLLVGNDTQHELKWPNNDKSSDQQWKIAVEIITQGTPQAAPSAASGRFTALTFAFVFVWNSTANTFSFHQNDSLGN